MKLEVVKSWVVSGGMLLNTWLKSAVTLARFIAVKERLPR